LIYFVCTNSSAVDCDVSKPNLNDPDGALKAATDFGWFGTEQLAAMIPADGRWNGMGKQHNYRNKFWWWHQGYDAKSRSANRLNITAKNLDNGTIITLHKASDAYQGSDNYAWGSMITAVEFPSSGCWRVSGSLGRAQLDINLYVGE